MTIFSQGGVNPAAFGVPGLYVQVNAPPTVNLAGAPSDIVALVGTATWGPKNSPVAFSDETGASVIFGSMNARKYDLATHIHAAVMQGARNFRAVRVTDGTDVAASAVVQTNGITITSKYTGSRGNQIQFRLEAGTKAGTTKATVMIPGVAPEVFDNIPGSANAAWLAIAAAINSGIAGGRKASEIVVATAGASTTTPTYGATVTLASGTDGATSITAATLVGSDTAPRTGMYALRNTGSAVLVLCDADDSTSWATQAAFCISEMTYGFGVSPSGDTVANFVTTQESSGLDTPWFKCIFGDWVQMLDTVAGYVRLVSPQSFLAGAKAALGPEKSLLNKRLYGIVGTQKSAANEVYSLADLQLIGQARGDVIVMNPPGGAYPAAAFGRNSSSDQARRQDPYTTMTNYLARSFDAASGLGQFVGELITAGQMAEARDTIGGFLQTEWDFERIGNAQNTVPYSVQIDGSNNPQSQIELGIEKATVMVQYLSVLEYFLVDFTGGQTVRIQSAQALAA